MSSTNSQKEINELHGKLLYELVLPIVMSVKLGGVDEDRGLLRCLSLVGRYRDVGYYY